MRPVHMARVLAALACLFGARWVAAQAPAPLPDPARRLTAAEAEALVCQVVILLDRDQPWDRPRLDALTALSQTIHHRAALPAMRRVLRDERENENARADVLLHMGCLGVPEAVDDSVTLLRSPVGRLRLQAIRVLLQEYPPGKQFGYVPSRQPSEDDAATRGWEEWWKANRETFKVKALPLPLFDWN